MLEEKKNSTRSKGRAERQLMRFLEEFSWLLSSYSSADFKLFPKVLSKKWTSIENGQIVNYVSDNPNIHFLTGALPGIFTDEKLFSTNEEIAEFSDMALGIRIPRWSKISKYEIIGHIVCSIQGLDDTRLIRLVKALNKVLAGDRRAQKLVSRERTKKRDWNLIIQELTSAD